MRTLPPWYKLSSRRLELERSILRSLPYFSLESERFDEQKRFIVVGKLRYRLERSGKNEFFKVRFEYPGDFPKRCQPVYDHDKRFEPGADGHLLSDYQLCLMLPDRVEFSLESEKLTEEVLGAALVWFDKRLIYQRIGKWPGPAERHGALARIDFILERAGLAENRGAVEWANQFYESACTDGRHLSADVYGPCPCGSGKKLKFCHGEQLRSLLKLFRAAQVSADFLKLKLAK